jgi:hypothetical protein
MAEKQTQKSAAKQAEKPAVKNEAQQKPDQPKDTGPKLTDITSAYLKKKELFDRSHESITKRIDSNRTNLERIQSSLTKAELQLSQLVEPSVKDDLVEPLAKALSKLLPETEGYDVIGPVGVQQAITISFVEKGASAEERLTGQKCRSITLVTKMDNGGIGVRDYSKDSGKFKPGSIGYASGLNHPVVEVPSDAGIRFLADLIK